MRFITFLDEATKKTKAKKKKQKRPCPKCEGTGYLPQYAHLRDGICWKCGGTGYMRDYDTEYDVWVDEGVELIFD